MSAPYLPSREPLLDVKTGKASSLFTLWMQALQALLFQGDPAGCSIRWGTGSPEGVVFAPQASVYLRIGGGAGTTFYVKESGTSNTAVGWVAK